MDPLTLFALANGAVSAVKAGCKLYKDIKNAAGDVRDVLKDLDDQFAKIHKDKPPTVEQKNDLIRKKNEVRELNKKANAGEHTNIYQEIGNKLGEYYDNYYKCVAIFEEEEKRSKNEVYTGDASLGKRALERVLMRKQLEQMGTELREIMVYQSPPELGALYTEVEEMMKIMGKEQRSVLAREIERNRIEILRKQKRKEQLTRELIIGVVILFSIFAVMLMLMYVIHLRQERFPELGNCAVPKGTFLYRKWTNTIWATCK